MVYCPPLNYTIFVVSHQAKTTLAQQPITAKDKTPLEEKLRTLSPVPDTIFTAPAEIE
jgi:hypothetical protein